MKNQLFDNQYIKNVKYKNIFNLHNKNSFYLTDYQLFIRSRSGTIYLCVKTIIERQIKN